MNEPKKKITREEYNKALDVIELYHKQLFESANGIGVRDLIKTKLLDWDKFHLCGTRLRHILINIDSDDQYKNRKPTYIEDLTWYEFSKYVHAGKVTWRKFTELRGY